MIPPTAGGAASAAWLEARGLDAARVANWYVEITIDTADRGARVDLNIYPEEWGFVFRHGARVSSIRVTDVPFVHGLDDYQLLSDTLSLERFGEVLDDLERRFDVRFVRDRARARTNLARATMAVRSWLGGSPR